MRLKYLVSMERFILTFHFQKKFETVFKTNKNVVVLRQIVTYISVRYVTDFSSVQIPLYFLTFYSSKQEIFGCLLSKQKREVVKQRQFMKVGRGRQYKDIRQDEVIFNYNGAVWMC